MRIKELLASLHFTSFQDECFGMFWLMITISKQFWDSIWALVTCDGHLLLFKLFVIIIYLFK